MCTDMCPAGVRVSVAVTLRGVYRHLRCKSLDRNCTCLTSLGLDHVKWNMRQLRAVRSRFTTWPHDCVLCEDRNYLNVIDKTENFLPRRRKQNRFSKRFFYTEHETMGNLTFMGPCIIIIFCYINPNKMHLLQSLFYLTTALHVSGVTITHLREHKQL